MISVNDPKNDSPETLIHETDSQKTPDVNNQSVHAVNSTKNKSHWTASLVCDGTEAYFKLDSGAEINVLLKTIYNSFLNRPKLKPTKITLTAYNNSDISVIGKCIAAITFKGKVSPVMIVVAYTDAQAVFGADTCEKLQLIKRFFKIDSNVIPALVEPFQDCFGNKGKLQTTHHISPDPNVPPVINPPRRVPFALSEKLKAELDKMTEMGIIVPVSEPTDWVNSLVIIEKPNGSLCVCLEPPLLE